MAVLRLNDDTLLVGGAGLSPELTSRVTGSALPLDEEQAIVATLLSAGPLEEERLLELAREEGVNWDASILAAFVSNLERWGLVDREEETPPDPQPRRLARPARSSDFEPAIDGDWVEDAEELPGGKTQVVAMDDIFGAPPHPPESRSVAPFAADPQAYLEDRPASSGESAKTLELSPAGSLLPLEEERPTASGESAKTIDLAPGSAPRAPEDLSDRSTEHPLPEHSMDHRLPERSTEHLPEYSMDHHLPERPTRTDSPVDAVPAEARPVEQAPPPVEEAQPQPAEARRPLLRLVPPPGGEDDPTTVAPKRQPSSPPQPQQVAQLSVPQEETGERSPHPRLLKKWMPKLLPQSRNILLVDPSENTERELRSWEYQVARMMEGQRSPEEVAEWAQSVGLQLGLDDVVSIIERLVREGVLEPGTTPLIAPSAAAIEDETPQVPDETNERARPDDADPELLEAMAGSPFKDMGESPDSIMESLAVLEVPGKRKMAPPVAVPASGPARGHPTGQQRPSGDVVLDALTKAASLVQAKRHDEAEKVLKDILERNPGVVQALAMLELIGGSTGEVRKVSGRPWALWIGLGGAGLALVTTLVLLLAIRVESKLTLPCRTELVAKVKVTSQIGGKVMTLEAETGKVVEKGAQLASVLDEERKLRIADLKHEIEDKKDLLRIMKTTGSVADERKQKKLIIAYTAELARLERCKGDDCARKVKAARAGIESAKLKLKFCEWQAEKDEIAELEGRIARLEQELAPLASKPLEATIVSPERGLLTEVKVEKGKPVKKDAIVATLADADRFLVMARHSGETPEGGDAAPARVTLVHHGSTQTFTAGKKLEKRGDDLVFDVPGDVSRVPQGAACEVEISKGTISLLGSWFE
jgi:multidrug efflux pump subunit AcrA (membrane-fusion protein)